MRGRMLRTHVQQHGLARQRTLRYQVFVFIDTSFF